jgi:hypothetical protein
MVGSKYHAAILALSTRNNRTRNTHRDTHVLPKLLMRDTTDVTGGKLLTVETESKLINQMDIKRKILNWAVVNKAKFQNRPRHLKSSAENLK